MIYNIHTCTVSKFSQILKDARHIGKVWIPSKLAERYKSNLIEEYNRLNNPNKGAADLIQNYYLLNLYNRINMYDRLRISFMHKVTKKNKDFYRELTGREYDSSTIKELSSKVKKLILKYEAEKPPEQSNDFDFDKYIAQIELILETKLNNVYLYQLTKYEELAAEKISHDAT